MKEECDRKGGAVDLSNANVHDVTGFLKLYLKELPEPLFTTDLFKGYLAIASMCQLCVFALYGILTSTFRIEGSPSTITSVTRSLDHSPTCAS